MVKSGVTRPPGVTAGPGVVANTVERMPAWGRSMPCRRQNMLAQAPPAQRTRSAAQRPRRTREDGGGLGGLRPAIRGGMNAADPILLVARRERLGLGRRQHAVADLKGARHFDPG